jgi:hypothetical protein
MNIGMLWYDNDPSTALTLQVNHAVEYYRQKYGCSPDLCLVRPSMLGEGPGLLVVREGKNIVHPNRSVLPGYLWIGSMKRTKSFLVQEEVTDPNYQLPRQPQWRLPYYD